ISVNPAAKRRGKGKRAGRSRNRGPEKAIVDALQALLVAERAALLSGRDDEFVLLVTKFFTGMRWGELIGLETAYARLGSLRVEGQLYELDTGELLHCPPKDDSYRDVDLPGWLSGLISDHITRTQPTPCACHDRTFVFGGRHGGVPGAAPLKVTMTQVAKLAEVAVGTVSNVLNHPDRVSDSTRVRVEAAVAELGFVRGGVPVHRATAAHWRRSGFAAWVFTPAASGWFPPKAPQIARPVPVTAEPWPGLPVRGRNSQGRAEAQWDAISADLTPHGLRHSLKTLMAEFRTPEVLSLERLGHEMGGIAGRYTHVTASMRKELMDNLTEEWHAALDARLKLSPGSPVATLEQLLRARERQLVKEESKIVPQNSHSARGKDESRVSL
ncbi:MAG: LacI family DNA-binding transcriptional regulator, partial [Streptosporangiaceae bacterium]